MTTRMQRAAKNTAGPASAPSRRCAAENVTAVGNAGACILVGTYWPEQMREWILPKGWYNYPVRAKSEETIPLERLAQIKELWLYNHKTGRKCFAAEFVRVAAKGDPEFAGYPAGAKQHGSGGNYFLFKVKPLSGPSTALRRAPVVVRLSDFAHDDNLKAGIRKVFLGDKATDEAKTQFLERLLPVDVFKCGCQRLKTCAKAIQLDFLIDLCSFGRAARNTVRFVDLFCGVGGIRMGMEAQGFKCVFSSDINKECQRTYAANFGEVPFGDIREIDAQAVPDHEILCAGFPCQPFSISGRQKGFKDTRGTLFFEICRILKVKKPPIVFLENVKHLVHHDHGNTLRTILHTLELLGYSVRSKILNGADFGLPQNRERIIIIGSLRGSFDFSKLMTRERIPLLEALDKDGDFEFLEPASYTLLADMRRQPGSGLMFAGYRNKSIRKVGVRPGTLHLSRVHKQPNRIYSVYGVHPTLPSQESSGRYFIRLPDDRVRKLTLNECWRIMGFPDDFCRVSAPGEQYRQLGNSVCVPMIKTVAQEIRTQFFSEAQP